MSYENRARIHDHRLYDNLCGLGDRLTRANVATLKGCSQIDYSHLQEFYNFLEIKSKGAGMLTQSLTWTCKGCGEKVPIETSVKQHVEESPNCEEAYRAKDSSN